MLSPGGELVCDSGRAERRGENGAWGEREGTYSTLGLGRDEGSLEDR